MIFTITVRDALDSILFSQDLCSTVWWTRSPSLQKTLQSAKTKRRADATHELIHKARAHKWYPSKLSVRRAMKALQEKKPLKRTPGNQRPLKRKSSATSGGKTILLPLLDGECLQTGLWTLPSWSGQSGAELTSIHKRSEPWIFPSRRSVIH